MDMTGAVALEDPAIRRDTDALDTTPLLVTHEGSAPVRGATDSARPRRGPAPRAPTEPLSEGEPSCSEELETGVDNVRVE